MHIINHEKIILDTKEGLEHYQVVDTTYGGRPARLLFSGDRQAAISGVARDGLPELLFDYNERFMELIRGLAPKQVLLLGGGTFTLPKAINHEFPEIALDVVEIDPLLYGIARDYFDFQPNANTKVSIIDAVEYLQTNRKKYDVIIIDVFLNALIPPSFQDEKLAQDLARALSPRGTIAMNIIASYHGRRSQVLRRQITVFRFSFKYLELFPAGHGLSLWLPQNFILTAQKRPKELKSYIRYEGLVLPITASDS